MNVSVNVAKLSPELRLSLILAAVCAALALLVLGESLGVDRMQRISPVSAEPGKGGVDKPAVGPFEFPDINEFEDLVERPLFVEGRKPPPEVVEEPPPVVSRTPLDLKLMGLIFSPSGKTALLVDPKGKYKRVKQGAVVGGWTLKELKKDSVVMQQDSESKELPLLKTKPKVALSGAPPAEAKPAKKPPGGLQPPDDGDEPPDEEEAPDGDENTDTESDGAEEEDQSEE